VDFSIVAYRKETKPLSIQLYAKEAVVQKARRCLSVENAFKASNKPPAIAANV